MGLADDLINLDQIAIKGSHSLGFQDPRYLTGGPPGDIRGTCGELITSVDALRLSDLYAQATIIRPEDREKDSFRLDDQVSKQGKSRISIAHWCLPRPGGIELTTKVPMQRPLCEFCTINS